MVITGALACARAIACMCVGAAGRGGSAGGDVAGGGLRLRLEQHLCVRRDGRHRAQVV